MAKDKDRKKDREKDRERAKPTAGGGKAGKGGKGDKVDAAGAGHHAARAHGRVAQVDTSLPATRPELMTLHAGARARRNSAPLGSDAFRAAVDDIARIEVRIAAIDRAADPPLG
ncbi:MAG TPA: hypothetical protein VK194_02160 [Candidatus Deferrimicrobium sp.]|nr:hypothetical protein [Candidatus Deferrimicrobium sp.]